VPVPLEFRSISFSYSHLALRLWTVEAKSLPECGIYLGKMVGLCASQENCPSKTVLGFCR